MTSFWPGCFFLKKTRCAQKQPSAQQQPSAFKPWLRQFIKHLERTTKLKQRANMQLHLLAA